MTIILDSLRVAVLHCEKFLSFKIVRFFHKIIISALIIQKKTSRGVLKKSCSESMQEIYRRTTMPKCDFNKAALQLY